MWVWPQVPLEAPPLHPLSLWDPSPSPAWAAPSRSLAKRAKGGGGKREWGKGPPITMGDGGDPPNTSWGQTHIWGLPKFVCGNYFKSCHALHDQKYIFRFFLSCNFILARMSPVIENPWPEKWFEHLFSCHVMGYMTGKLVLGIYLVTISARMVFTLSFLSLLIWILLLVSHRRGQTVPNMKVS